MKFNIGFQLPQASLWLVCSFCCIVQTLQAMELGKCSVSESAKPDSSLLLKQDIKPTCVESYMTHVNDLAPENCHRRVKSDSDLKKESVQAQSPRVVQAVSLSKILLPIQRGIPQATPMPGMQFSAVRCPLISNDNPVHDVRLYYAPGHREPRGDGYCCDDADCCLMCCIPVLGIPLTGIGILWLKKALDPVQ